MKLTSKIFLSLPLSLLLMSNSFAHEPMTKEYCTSGESGQSVADCLKELRNSKKEKFDNFNSSSYKENKLHRCASVPDKTSCEDRILNGVTSGSVKDGGTITEIKTQLPMPEQEVEKFEYFTLEK